MTKRIKTGDNVYLLDNGKAFEGEVVSIYEKKEQYTVYTIAKKVPKGMFDYTTITVEAFADDIFLSKQEIKETIDAYKKAKKVVTTMEEKTPEVIEKNISSNGIIHWHAVKMSWFNPFY